MPTVLDTDFQFHLTIIGFDVKKSFHPIASQKSSLETFLKSQFPYQVNLTIIRADHHDRSIYTNYARLTSGKGFGLFKKNKISKDNETSMAFYPVTNVGRFSSSSETRDKELKKCKEANRTERMPDKLAGNRINRLLQ